MDRRIDVARHEAHSAEQEVVQLKARLHSMEVACEGLWMLLKEKLACTDDELRAAIEGVNRQSTVVGICPNCGRQLLTKHAPNCNWCGLPVTRPEGRVISPD